jgi:hypothetical protein
MDLNNPKTWRDIKPGDVILISDQQSLEDSVKAGLGMKPLQYTVVEITEMNEMSNLATWIFYRLKPTAVQQELMLMCKLVDSEMDVRLYYETDFTPGSRSEIIQRGDLFLFQAPTDPDNFKASELNYSMDLTHEGNRWVKKDFGEMHGEISCNPPKSGLTDMVATVVEYLLVEGQSLDTDILITEIGKGAEGLVKMFAGCTINTMEIQIFPI